MIRVAPVLCVGILAVACFACVPSAPPSPPAEGLQPALPLAAPPPLVGTAGPRSCTKQLFLSKVLYRATPVAPIPGSTPPTQGDSFPASPDYLGNLGKAFDAASDQFQERLCGLDVVYVQNAACANAAECFGFSWGWQQIQKVTVPHGQLVALSTSLWNGPQTYSQYETDLLRSVLPTTGANYSCAGSGSCSSIDGVETRLLAALAHEVGHIRWNDPTLIDQAHPRTFCNGGFFDKHWRPVNRQPRWRNLLTRSERDDIRRHGHWLDAHSRPPHIDTIDSSTPAQLIADLFDPAQPWASGLAAISPDEDFVETYKFKVLTTMRAPLTSVTVTIPLSTPGSQNIPVSYFNAVNGADTRKADLVRKVNCIPDTL